MAVRVLFFAFFIVRYIGSPWPRGLACCRGYGRCGTGRHGNTRSWGLKSQAHPLPPPQWNSLPRGAEWRKMSTTSKWYLTSKKTKAPPTPGGGGRCKGLCVICRPAKCPARLFLHAGGFRLRQIQWTAVLRILRRLLPSHRAQTVHPFLCQLRFYGRGKPASSA